MRWINDNRAGSTIAGPAAVADIVTFLQEELDDNNVAPFDHAIFMIGLG